MLCDTNGGTLTDELLRIVEARAARWRRTPAPPPSPGASTPTTTPRLAVANSLAAVQAGIRHVQATINGYGERCGNANMVSVIAEPRPQDRPAAATVGGGEIAELTSLSRSVAEIANVAPNDYQPFVGRSAFAHKGGVHVAAVAKVERSYQHVDPGRSATRTASSSRSWAAGPTRHPGQAAGPEARRRRRPAASSAG